MSTVSAVIPVYNGERFIERCLKGITWQTRPVDEIVVVNDGSTDNSEQIIKSMGLKNLVYERTSNSGTARTRKKGIQLATGDFVAFCDQDDCWLPEKIERQLKAIQGYDLVHTNAVLMTEGKPDQDFWDARKVHPARGGKELLPEFFNRNQIISPSVMARRTSLLEALDAEVDFDKCADIDYSLWLRMLEKGFRFTFINEPLIEYHSHSGQLTKRLHKMSLWQKSVIQSFLKRNPGFRRDHPFLVGKKLLKTHVKVLLCSIP